jgi:hypothetical protein
MMRAVTIVTLWVGVVLAPEALAGSLLWPLTCDPAECKLMSVMEFMHYGEGRYIHKGVDIAAPRAGQEGAPWVVAVAAGEVIWDASLAKLEPEDESRTGSPTGANQLVIRGEDGTIYTYAHLDYGTLEQEGYNQITAAIKAGWPDTHVGRGEPLAGIGQFGETCESDRLVDHLHLDIERDGRLLDPLRLLDGYTDDEPPRIEAVVVCSDWDQDKDGPTRSPQEWEDCQAFEDGTCGVIIGENDILVEVSDRQFASSDHVLGIRDWTYRLCPESEPDCTESMPDPVLHTANVSRSWGEQDIAAAAILYSWREDYPSKSDYCETDEFHVVATNVANHEPSATPSLNTLAADSWGTGHRYPDGFYTLTVDVSDFSGNEDSISVPVCVDNYGQAGGKLLVRDCDGDSGTEPSGCPTGTTTPDVTFHREFPWEGWVGAYVYVSNVGARSIEGPIRFDFKAYTKTDSEIVLAGADVVEVPVGRLWPLDGRDEDDPWKPGQRRFRLFSWGALEEFRQALDGDNVRLEVSVSSVDNSDIANDEEDIGNDNNRASLKIE